MKQILLDTNAYVAFKRGAQEALEIIQGVEAIGISTIVLGELLSGFSAGRREAENRRGLDAFLESARVTVLAVDEETADCYSRVYRGLKRKGKPIPTNDLWIAATALQHGAALFSYDKHFAAVDGVIVVNRLADIIP